MRWSREHPILTLTIPVFLVLVIAAALSGNDTSSQSGLNCPPSQRIEVNGRFVCQPGPVRPPQSAATSDAASAAAGVTAVSDGRVGDKAADFSDVDEFVASVSFSGTYAGTVHNRTVNLSSTFTAVIHETKDGVLDGCMKVHPPLYGSGVLRGSIRGSHVNFTVADITFQGRVSKTGITGSYVVTRQEGSQLGDFRLTKQTRSNTSYVCTDGEVTKFEVVDAAPSSQQFSDVPPGAQALPPAANLAVRTPNAAASDSIPSAEHAAPNQPDLSGLTSSERQSIESACSQAKYLRGPAAYDQCLARQIQSWSAGPKQPDLSSLTSPERQSIESACSQAKYLQGPAAYNECLVRQIQSWSAGPKRPDLSNLTSSERQSIESACSQAKYLQGPAAYNQCLVRQLQALTDYRQ
jgi:hypothetical protein